MKVGIIGGGASGIMAALVAANDGAKVTILEHMPRIGKKILLTGSGKCNLTNSDMNIEHFHCSDKSLIESVLKECPRETTLSFLHDLGLITKEKNGYFYPYSESAATVLDVFRFAIRDYGVNVVTDVNITSISNKEDKNKPANTNREPKQFIVNTDKEKYYFDRIIICCGSKAYKNTGSDGSGYSLAKNLGHNIIKPVSSLTYLICRENYYSAIAGIRTNARVELYVNKKCMMSRFGQLQLTKQGISGIPVFDLSFIAARGLEANKEVYAQIDFLNEYSSEELTELLLKRAKSFPDRIFEELFTGILNKNLGLCILKQANVKLSDSINILQTNKGKELLKSIVTMTKCFKTYVKSVGDFDSAQVCAGGVDLSEISYKLESKLVKGLYFAGEILDVNGDCGGYNLQWAFSSAYVAAKGCLGK